MHPALFIGKTGLDAATVDISVVSNNLANASTIGFKKDRAVFEDLLYQNINQPGGRSSADTELPSGLQIGAGSKVVATQKAHTQGNLQTTDNSLDLSIQGAGYFEILQPDGSLSYTRNGQFTLDDTGQIVTPGAGFLLQPNITVPDDAQQLTISQDGEVTAQLRGQPNPVVLGQINITDFINPAGLQPVGQNLFVETGSSGTPIQGVPGLQGLGTLAQGTLETSNVNVTEELVNLIESQRLFEMNSKVISTVDQMLAAVIQQL
jgi:flagellar basal-body rod protein FlgG